MLSALLPRGPAHAEHDGQQTSGTHRLPSFRLLNLLQDQPEMSHRELAQGTVTNVKLQYCIQAQIDTGPIKLGNSVQWKH
jgi:hypothetical protein